MSWLSTFVPEWSRFPTVGPDGLPLFVDLRDKGFGKVIIGWCTSEIEPILARMPANSIALDIGANIGVWTRLMSCQFGDGHVYAFEPSTPTFRLLTRNLETRRNVTCIHAAVGAETAAVAFAGDDVAHGLRHIVANGTPGSEIVQCYRLSDWWSRNGGPRLDFIKVDVEGLEAEVLMGARELLDSLRPTIVFEFIPRFARRRSRYPEMALFDELRSLGYDLFRLDKEGGHHRDFGKDRDWTNDYMAVQYGRSP